MMLTPERHLPTSGQHGPAPSGAPPPAQPPPPLQTRETQSHSAPTRFPTPLKRPMLTPEGGPRPRVKRLGTWTLVRPQKGAAARIVPKGTTARSAPYYYYYYYCIYLVTNKRKRDHIYLYIILYNIYQYQYSISISIADKYVKVNVIKSQERINVTNMMCFGDKQATRLYNQHTPYTIRIRHTPYDDIQLAGYTAYTTST